MSDTAFQQNNMLVYHILHGFFSQSLAYVEEFSLPGSSLCLT